MDASLRRLSAPSLTAPLRAVDPARGRLSAWVAAGVLGLVYALPVLGALLAAAAGLAAPEIPLALAHLADDPQWRPALGLSVFTALTSTVLALAVALALATALTGTSAWERLSRRLGVALAVPHVAFAIGLALLVMPAGWLARLIAPLPGWLVPPGWWVTVQDPYGLTLTAALVCKEVPFLLWSIAALWRRPEVASDLQRSLWLGRSLGHPAARVWWRVLWPRWLPALTWPVLAVLAYSLTVVDVALVLGPTQPPTLAVLAWQALVDADPVRNAEGLLLAWGLTAALAGCAWLLALAGHLACRAMLRRAERGVEPLPSANGLLRLSVRAFDGARLAAVGSDVYVAVLLALLLASVSGAWRFPSLWPQGWSDAAWQQVVASTGTVGLTAALALGAALLAVALVIAWLEATPPAWDRAALPLVLAPLVLPQLVLAAGLYRLALAVRLDGGALGLLWGHVLMVMPYVFVSLAPAWRSHDPRWALAAAALGRSRGRFLWSVKWPMLRGPLAAGAAVGVAVSVGQYLVTQFLGSGRWPTLSTEAVTLAAGGQRAPSAALAVLQAGLPLIAFGLAAWWGKIPAATLQTDPR